VTLQQTAPTPCLIVTGMPGAGKSTVTRLAAELLPQAARMDGDFVNRLVVSGRVWALGEPADEVELCRGRPGWTGTS
jgi:dephospho-CoA kinase